MKVVSVKFDEHILKEVDRNLQIHNFNSRTEFIRDAIRDKLEDLKKERALLEFLKFKGKSKIKTSDEENFKNKKEIEKQFLDELEKRFK